MNYRSEKTALVLSGCGMFGAYQAGVWKALQPRMKPDIVIGTSAGALNGWAIASDCPPTELIARWLDLRLAAMMQLRLPPAPWKGLFNDKNLTDGISELHAAYRPKAQMGVALVQMPLLRQCLFHTHQVTHRHLVAACAIPGWFPPVRIGGALYCDACVIDSLNLWAAHDMGATTIVAVNAMPALPFKIVKNLLGLMPSPFVSKGVTTELSRKLMISPSAPLGSVMEAMSWDRDRVGRLIRQGEHDAHKALSHGFDWRA
jgi:predicted acylesterase/phospholipase RssA